MTIKGKFVAIGGVIGLWVYAIIDIWIYWSTL